MSKEATCPNCGKRFQPWRKKEYCSERCRKQAQNRRLGYVQAILPDEPKSKNLDEQNQEVTTTVRRDEPDRLWTAVNEVTHKLSAKGGNAIAWAIYIDREKGWFGRVKDDLSFGPTSLSRAMKAVEAHLRNEPFEKRQGERSWRGNCLEVL